ncbi:MAG: GntR family transcriptional regulator [Wenzhouxiangella sp.]|jgi:GntR family transcriptional regulator|nr:GntR family transcriptional regulator [Wenzhouxiangella sp.]
MSTQWDDNQPIYWQLRERTVAAILDGALDEGQPLPSVRQVAVDFQVNPLTVSKAYQSLVDDELVEKKRGVGMFVCEGARSKLLESERERYLSEEWPRQAEKIRQLGLNVEELVQSATASD